MIDRMINTTALTLIIGFFALLIFDLCSVGRYPTGNCTVQKQTMIDVCNAGNNEVCETMQKAYALCMVCEGEE